jgi:hypothetical protein
MPNQLHSLWIRIEGALEKLRVKDRPLHFIITFFAIAIPVWIFTTLSEKLVDELEWGTIMKCLLYAFLILALFCPTIIFLIMEIRAARAKQIQLSFTGWVFGLVVVVLFILKQTSPMAGKPVIQTKFVVPQTQTEFVTNTVEKSQPQWFFKISNITVIPKQNPPWVSFRLTISVNDQRYSYPTRTLWVNGFTAPHESWPIPYSDNGYKIGIGGFVGRNSGKRIVILSGKDEPFYYPDQLPIKTNCDTTVTDPDFPNPSETQIHIDYEITTNR